MSLHRAVVFFVVAFFICCSASPGNAATDTQYLYVAHTTASLVQNSGTESVIVYRNGSTSGAVSVLCKTVNGTAISGRDFTAVSTTLKWASGDATAKQCSVPISDTTPFSGPRTFVVQLSGPTGIALNSADKVTVTVYGNKGGGTVSVAAPTYTVAQSTGKATITVNRAGGSAGPADVTYATANSSAIAGTDYTSVSGQLSWANGDAAPKSFSIPISNAKPFTGTKTLAIALADPINADLGSAKSAIVTIDGGATSTAKPSVTISATPTAVESGESPSLTWTATSATTCTASGGWSGLMPSSGTTSPGAISESTTYTLSCTGTGGSASQSVTVSVVSAATANASACPVTSGPLTLKVSAIRTTGISPFLMFFDATGTTDTSIAANTTAFQNVTYTWNFGDTGTSGTSTWAYGSNPGKNSKNTATGGIAAHLYVTSGTDTAYKATVTATDGTNTATCSVPVTAYNPSGANGFAGTKTTCVAASSAPVAGSGDCPAGAAVLKTSSFTSATGSSYVGAGKRVLFHCGDTFTGSASTVSGAKWSIGAYGGCEGTQTSRPIIKGSLGINMQATGDGRVADLDFESVGSSAAVYSDNNYDYVTYQITMYNLLSHGNDESYYMAQCAQCGYIQLVQTGMGSNQGTYINFAENNQSQWGTNSLYNNIDYQAVLGNSFSGVGAPNNGSGIETVRVSACRMCVFANNTIENANDVGAVLKLHNGNTKNSSPTWTGVYTELIEISDNLFSGTSGADLVETAPQNSNYDERLRNIVVERNIFQGSDTGGGRQILVSAVNETLRDNVFNQSVAGGGQGIQVARRGIEPVPQFVQIYNNTCDEGTCAAFSGSNFTAPGINSWAENNLCYLGSCISNSGTGNTVGNNSTSTSSNPGFTNASGSLKIISDFKPTESYTGATTVPVRYDALGAAWSPTWNLGAVHH
jgi:Calx-beta domain